MRRVSVLVVLFVLASSAGCTSRPPGVDGKLTNNWPAIDAPKIVSPVVGTCYTYGGEIVPVRQRSTTSDQVTCAPSTSLTEVAYVGTFTGADAQRTTPPPERTSARRAAYDQCQQAASTYLGGDWHLATAWLIMVLPTDAAWEAGARWFRCDLGEYAAPIDRVLTRQYPAKDGLVGNRPLAITCMTTKEDSSGNLIDEDAIDCAQPHAAEFAGVFIAPDLPWSAKADERNKLADRGCDEVVGRFLGFSNASWNNASIGYLYSVFDEARWNLGDRSARCYAYAFTKSKVMVGSVKGIRGGKPRES